MLIFAALDCWCHPLEARSKARTNNQDFRSTQVVIPSVIKDLESKLDAARRFEGDGPEARLKIAGARKSLANEFKRSRGKLVVARKLDLVGERAAEEKQMVEETPAAGVLLQDLENIYYELEEGQPVLDALSGLRGAVLGSALLAAAHAVREAASKSIFPSRRSPTDCCVPTGFVSRLG